MTAPLAASAAPVMAHPVYPGSYNYEGFLATSEGLLIRERFFWSQVLCGACERKTQFKLAQWNSSMPQRMDDDFFQAQPAIAEIREESECCCRYCCHQFRELKLGMFQNDVMASSMGYDEKLGWPQDQAPMLVMDRPFKCPLACCCFMPWPFEMSVSKPQDAMYQPIGRAVYDFKWYNCCWCCDQHMNLYDGAGQHLYKVHSPFCCGGCCAPSGSACCANCCAPSCCASTFTSTIHDAHSNEQVGSWENQWPGWNVRGICAGNSGAKNYVLKFPNAATPEQKALMMTGMFLANFIYFEKRANQK